MASLLILFVFIGLKSILKDFDLWFKLNSMKVGFVFIICAFIDSYIIYRLFKML